MSEDFVLANDNYHGVYWFSIISEWTELPLDQVNLVLTQLVSLSIAPLFRTLLHPARVSADIRHGLGLTLGALFGYICFGYHAIHLITLPTLTYTIMCFQSPKTMHRSVLVVSLLYLSTIHLHRQYYFSNSYTLDISGPLMIIVQKITSLALNLHDGLTKEDEEMNDNQKYHAIDRIPTIFEYFSYIFHHQTLMAGPLIFYRDYMHFIQGTYLLDALPKPKSSVNLNIIQTNGDAVAPSKSNLKQTNNNTAESYRIALVEPSPYKAVMLKVLGGVACALIYLKLSEIFPLDVIREDDFVLNTTLVYKLYYLNIVTTLTRFKYYYAWLLGDAVCNNSGLGFNGYDEKGNAKWDKVSNINVLGFEFSTSLRDGINAWNIQTNKWLRMVVYDRVAVYATLLTYTLSAVWHGFYLGYYITFISATLYTMAARTIRRYFRHYFQHNRSSSIFYDILTGFVTRVLFGYLTFSFIILDFEPSLRLLVHMYFIFHVLSFIVVLFVPKIMPKPTRIRFSTTEEAAIPSKEDNNGGVVIENLSSNGTISKDSIHKKSLSKDSFYKKSISKDSIVKNTSDKTE